MSNETKEMYYPVEVVSMPSLKDRALRYQMREWFRTMSLEAAQLSEKFQNLLQIGRQAGYQEYPRTHYCVTVPRSSGAVLSRCPHPAF